MSVIIIAFVGQDCAAAKVFSSVSVAPSLNTAIFSLSSSYTFGDIAIQLAAPIHRCFTIFTLYLPISDNMIN